MKLLLFFFAAVIGGMLYIHQSLQNGTVLRYVDTHSTEERIPEAAYYLGQTYYLFKNLPEASTYFIRVAERYPTHPLGDDALFAYIQCLDDTPSSSREQLVAGYRDYLEKYPNGNHVELANTRIANYMSSR